MHVVYQFLEETCKAKMMLIGKSDTGVIAAVQSLYIGSLVATRKRVHSSIKANSIAYSVYLIDMLRYYYLVGAFHFRAPK